MASCDPAAGFAAECVVLSDRLPDDLFVASGLFAQRRWGGGDGGELVRREPDPCGPQLTTAAAERRVGRRPSRTHAHTHSASSFSSSVNTQSVAAAGKETGAGSQQTVSLDIYLPLPLSLFEDFVFLPA